MSSVPENNHIGNFVTDGQYLNANNSIGNGDFPATFPGNGPYLLADGTNYLLADNTPMLLA